MSDDLQSVFIFDPWAFHVLVPDQLRGVSVCSVGKLVEGAYDAVSLDDLISNAAIDSASPPDEILNRVDKVRKLNATGDAEAYWDAS